MCLNLIEVFPLFIFLGCENINSLGVVLVVGGHYSEFIA